ncbi:MAG: choloylglycine hydrolase family protein [Ruminococcaceae bacterium]|nr:choloylglycine hydrolase family protein [Oscillospiraceae bacterium]
MCTALFLKQSHLFGRTLDVSRSYGESAVIVPRGFPFPFRHSPICTDHPAILGIARIEDGVPLFFDGMNEYGLAAAGLNFPGYAVYHAAKTGHAAASYEFIPWILCHCRTLADVRVLLEDTGITSDSFRDDLPPTPLHWMIADPDGALTVEQTADGLQIFENTVGVLTNSPPFPYHMTRLCDFMACGDAQPDNRLYPQVSLIPCSNGMGSIGLPGDFSSASRFARAAFMASHAPSDSGIDDFFHRLDCVSIPRGCVTAEDGGHFTAYASCADLSGIAYHFTTYSCRSIRSIHLNDEDADGCTLTRFDMS